MQPTWFLKKLRWGLAKLAVLGKNSLENFVVISCIQRCISCTQRTTSCIIEVVLCRQNVGFV